jgi:hypothetical protein
MKPSALLSLNPELQRGLWLELTPSRLVAAPVVLLLLIGAIASVISPTAAAGVDRTVMWGLLVLWGSRLAAESVDDEVTGRTWDLQRLSAQTPWGLTLGKLFGGTVFAWYGAAICALALVGLQYNAVGTIIDAVLGGLTAQGTALLAALVLNRFNTHDRRTHTTLAQVIGIVLGWKSGFLPFTAKLPFAVLEGHGTWYGMDIPGLLTALQIASIFWLIFGAMRIIRRELGFVDGPLGWTLYTVYAVVLAAGFVPGDADLASVERWSSHYLPPVARLTSQSIVWVVAVSLTYGAALGVPVSRIALRKLSAAAAARDWGGIWRNLPVWTPSAIVSALVALALTVQLGAAETTNGGALIPLAALGFLMRDIALITFLRLTYRQRTAMALLVMFLVLYAVLPFLLGHLTGGLLTPLFAPGFNPGVLGLIAPWAEAAFAAMAVWRLWRAPSTLAP